MKVVYCLAIGLFLSTGGILLQQSPSPLQQPTASEKQRIKNERLVRKHFRDDIESAKEADRKEVVLPGIIEMPIVTPSMSDIANKYSLLRVRVITKETIVSEPYADINTWYKLEILEAVCQQDRTDDEPLPKEAPSDFLPLLPSESLLVIGGGEVVIDGIRVIRSLAENQFVLAPDKEYLIAAYLEFGGKLIRPVAKAAGVFAISDSALTSLGLKNNGLVREIDELYGNNLDRLRIGIRQRRGREK